MYVIYETFTRYVDHVIERVIATERCKFRFIETASTAFQEISSWVSCVMSDARR